MVVVGTLAGVDAVVRAAIGRAGWSDREPTFSARKRIGGEPDAEALDEPGDAPGVHLEGVALGELHAFYRRTGAMLANLLRDEPTMPLVAERFAVFRGYLAAAQDTLMEGRDLRGDGRRRTRAALGHAIAFSTWSSLVREQGLDAGDAGRLLRALVAAAGPAAGGGPRP